jgi:predicted amidohydrolase YtcJ
MSLFLRNVRPWGGAPTALRVSDGKLDFAVARQPSDQLIDGKGWVLLPGLHDHHLHLLALAARYASVDLGGVLLLDDIRDRLALAPPGPMVRAVDYDERAAGLPDASLLDRWCSSRPLRLADRTGALWVLNSAAMDMIKHLDLPKGAERDPTGRPNGRFWREDRWLGEKLPRVPLDLYGLGRRLASFGLCALTDAGAHNGPAEAEILAGSLPQSLTLMGSEALQPGHGYQLGPLKLLLDERELPDFDATVKRIAAAHEVGRNAAAHCVTESELAFYLAALDAAGGASPGDRIEHGGMIPQPFIAEISRMGLTVVTNPSFIHDRGDRYRDTLASESWRDLYRAKSLQRVGIPLLAGSDAPYASVDPWLAMRTARDRLTSAGFAIGKEESLPPLEALRLYTDGDLENRSAANFILCEGDLAGVLTDLDAARVRLTVIGGEPAYCNF